LFDYHSKKYTLHTNKYKVESVIIFFFWIYNSVQSISTNEMVQKLKLQRNKKRITIEFPYNTGPLRGCRSTRVIETNHDKIHMIESFPSLTLTRTRTRTHTFFWSCFGPFGSGCQNPTEYIMVSKN
jgi:hypothetical protein